MINVNNIDDLFSIRNIRDESEINLLLSGQLLDGFVPFYALKYCIWSLEEMGVLKITAPKTIDMIGSTPHKLSFQLLVQIVCRAMPEYAEITDISLNERQIIIKRTKKELLNKKWSIGIIYSGSKGELQLLKECIKAIKRQESSGVIIDEIVVCGPEENEVELKNDPKVTYLKYESPYYLSRFLVGKKKNYLIKSLRNEKLAIMHCRIKLGNECLSSIPEEFDVITPSVFIKAPQPLRYLDLGFQSFNTLSPIINKTTPNLTYNRDKWYKYLRFYYPYVDGGLFITNKNLARSVPLSECVAWGEGEDVEWCQRLLANNRLLELAVHSHAFSMTCKLPRYKKYARYLGYKYISFLYNKIRYIIR